MDGDYGFLMILADFGIWCSLQVSYMKLISKWNFWTFLTEMASRLSGIDSTIFQGIQAKKPPKKYQKLELRG